MSSTPSILVAAAAALSSASTALAGIGWGVTGGGVLFNFDLDNPNNPVVTVGNVGFVPEGIDFRPGTGILYAVDVGATTTQVFTIDTLTAAATPVGAGFATVPAAGGYNLGGGQSFGFDFNPRTLQGDGSVRIRLVSSGGSNLRLNSDTGGVANVDTFLAYAGGGDNPNVTAAAYINSNASTIASAGLTSLYVMDFANDRLYLQNPPNNGTLVDVGAFGATINGAPGGSFDILTDQGSSDDTIGGDTGYAVYQRDGVAGGQYVMYLVNLGSGATTGGVLVGNNGTATGADFTGGFAVIVPTPGAGAVLGLGLLVGGGRRRR